MAFGHRVLIVACMLAADKRSAEPDGVGPPDRDDGAAEAARWVEDALANARGWFSELSEEDLRGPLEQAFELASRTARGERELHAVFEAELRRVLEERDVMGSAGSVLPSRSSDARRSFQAVADAAEEPAVEEPEDEAADHA